jgi:peptidoglycan/xylan/chitin deacetylase (PgdA/CDA1 family)
MIRRISVLGLGTTGLATKLIGHRPKLRRALLILGYHRIVPMRDPDEFPFDSDLVSATPEEFMWQMQYIRRHLTPIGIDVLLAALAGERELPPRAVVVTFDDGYDDCVNYALPVLKAEGVPGCVFVASGQIGSAETFWFDQLAHALLTTDIRRLELPQIGIVEDLGPRGELRRALYGRVVDALKSVPDAARIEVLENVKRQCRVRPDPSVAALSRPMSEEQVVQAARSGLSIQSHTVTHPILANLDPERMKLELADSRETIGRLTGIAPEVLAYPNGTWSDFGQREVDAARACGYRAAMTYESGYQTTNEIDPFRLLRLPVNWRHSRGWFRTMLAVPEVASGPPVSVGFG